LKPHASTASRLVSMAPLHPTAPQGISSSFPCWYG